MNRCKEATLFAILLLGAADSGCDFAKVEEAVNTGVEETTRAVESTVETVKQEAHLVGSVELSTEPPMNAKACYAKLIILGSGRPNVLQLASYKSVDLERFPSVFMQAQVEANSLDELVGQTVRGELYAQAEENGTIWHSPTGTPAAITVSTIDEESMTCQCNGVTLVNTATGEQSTVSGKFVALIE